MEEHYADVDGLRMRWLEQGRGVPVVFIHGIPTGPELWRKVVPRVRGARCLAWEMVGYGASIQAGARRDLAVASQARYLVAWLQAVGIDHAIFAGHDLGGGVAQIAAVEAPATCAGLFLTNTIAYDSWPIPSVLAMQKAHRLVERLPNAVFERVFQVFLLRGHETAKDAKAAMAVHWPRYRQAGGAEAFVRQVHALDSRDTERIAPRLKTLTIPARIAWGAADRFQKLAYGKRLARDLGAPLHVLPGARHFTPEDRPEEIASEVNALVAQVLKRGRASAPAMTDTVT